MAQYKLAHIKLFLLMLNYKIESNSQLEPFDSPAESTVSVDAKL